MDISMLIVTLIAITLSAFFSGMEIAFVSSNKVRATLDAHKDGFLNRIINLFYNNFDMVISTLLVGNNIVLVVYGMSIAILLKPVLLIISANEAVILTLQTIISTIIILLMGEYVPKMMFRINPNDSLRALSLPLYLFYLILYPISWFSSFISNMLMKLTGVKIAPKNLKGITVGELDAFIQENIDKKEDENIEVEREVKIFQNALDFSNTHLRDCIIPRNEIISVNIDNTDRDSLCRKFNETGLSKIVVYKNDIDNIVGYIHVSELFHSECDWTQHIKPVLFAPETMLANKMMRSLLGEKKSMAIVIDEFGGTAGLVTLEDLVEEIFGDIEDEHDRKRIMARKIDENTYDFAGRIEIEQLNEIYHLDIPESDEYITLAGYLLYNLEALPEEGETIEIESLAFTILKKSATKIELVRVDTSKKS
ncbi:MAG: hemolysin family protein [Muribaculaceae bacterium]|nr:hemolysin family protein [Muribaculaceae bacterium]